MVELTKVLLLVEVVLHRLVLDRTGPIASLRKEVVPQLEAGDSVEAVVDTATSMVAV